MRVLPKNEEILRCAQEGCVFYLRMKRSFAALRRDACSTSYEQSPISNLQSPISNLLAHDGFLREVPPFVGEL
ncbi:MAG: hypothetical protein ACPGWR_05450 [Ardenticatenaceae bacterium]